MQVSKKVWYKKWWVWLIVGFVLIGIIGANQPKVETKTITETEVIRCEEQRVDDDTIILGEEVVERECQDGVRTITYEATFTNSKETKREKTKEEVTTQPVHKLVKVGTRVESEETIEATLSPTPASSSQPAPAASSRPTPSTSTYYENCTAAKDAGVAPIYIGQPGYRPELDRDRDGVACETY
jgi:hypothetical protein